MQEEASKKNLRKGRRAAPKMTEDDEAVIRFPFGYRKPRPDEFASLAPTDLHRWELLGSQDTRGKDSSRLGQIEIGWGMEHDQRRRELLHKKVFKRKPTIKVRELLRFLLPKVSGFPDRTWYVQETLANFQILVTIAGRNGYLFPEDCSYLQEAVRLTKGEVFHGPYASLFQCLADQDADIDLEAANQVSGYVLVYRRYFRSKSSAGHLNGKKRVAKLRSAEAETSQEKIVSKSC